MKLRENGVIKMQKGANQQVSTAPRLLRKTEQKEDANISIRTTKNNAFTLTELLVTIGVIGVLAAITLPALSNAKAKAKYIQCVNNQRQVYQIMNMTVSDYCQSGNINSLYNADGSYTAEGNELLNSMSKSLCINPTPDPYINNCIRPALLTCPTAKLGNPASYFVFQINPPQGTTAWVASTTIISLGGFDANAPQTSDPLSTHLAIFDSPPAGLSWSSYPWTTGNIFGQPITFDTSSLHKDRGPGVVVTYPNGSISWVKITPSGTFQ